jgi:hypothetical protein
MSLGSVWNLQMLNLISALRNQVFRKVVVMLPAVLAFSTLQLVWVPPAKAIITSDGLCKADLGNTSTASIKRSGRYCYIVFRSGSNSFKVPEGISKADFLVIGGGGAGGSGAWGGGGGAGEVVKVESQSVNPSTSVSVVVGSGGTPGAASLTATLNRSTSGETSTIGTLNANGGGAGASYAYNQTASLANGSRGGSGGGGTEYSPGGQGGVALKLSSGLGNNGGNGTNAVSGGGGGGAGGAGQNATTSASPVSHNGGAGGIGTDSVQEWITSISSLMSASWVTATSTGRIAAGGGGGAQNASAAAGGAGGGGAGGINTVAGKTGVSGTVNTGSGGGGASYAGAPPEGAGGSGASGLAVVRFAIVSADVLKLNFDASDTLSLPVGGTTWTSVTPGSELISGTFSSGTVTRELLNQVPTVKFAGASAAYINLGNSSSTANGNAAYTVESWVNMSSYRAGSSWNIFASKWFSDTSRGQSLASQEWHFAIQNNYLNVYTSSTSASCSNIMYTEKVFSSSDINKWFHIAFTVATNGDIKIYLNGIPSATVGINCGLPTSKNGLLFLGDVGSNLSFVGNMSKFRTYGKALSDAELLRNYNVETAELGITKYTRVLTVDSNSFAQSYKVLDSPPTLTSTVTSGIGVDTGTPSVTYATSTPAACTVNSTSGALAFVAPGTCTVTASIVASDSHLAASDTETITIAKDNLNFTLSASATIKYGSTETATYTVNRSLGARVISGTLSFETSTSTACNINGVTGVVTMLRSAGTCQIRVRLTSDMNYSDTSSALVTISPAKADTLTVTASAIGMTYNGNAQVIPYSYSISGLKFSDTLTALSYRYTGNPNSGGTANGTTTVNSAGLYTISPETATISNSDSYTAITYATGALTVNRAPRTISGSAAGSVKYGAQETLTITTVPASNSDGTLSFAAGSSTACSVVSDSGRVTMNRASGTCSIIPIISQGANYLTATGSAVSITPAKADAIIVTADGKTSTYTGSATSIAPTYSVSGLQFQDTVTVTYGYSGSMNNGDLYSFSSTKPTNAGTYSIIPMVIQTNSDSYTASATINSGALTISRASRTVSPSTYSKTSLKYGESATVTSNVTSPSTNDDGAFSYSVGSGCTIDSGSGAVTAANYVGTCSSTTSILQGYNYESATAATTTNFSLSKADTITVTASSPPAVTFTGSAASVTPTISVSGLVAGNTATGATYNFARGNTCAQGGVCQVGDTGPAGGKVFYVSSSVINAVDGISSGGTYLEIAPATFSKTTFNWCEGPGTPYTTLIGASTTTIGSGAANTKIMIDNCTGGAGVSAANLTFGGKSDWFLPSYSEMVQIYGQRVTLGLGAGQSAAGFVYWSSTESANWTAYSLVPWAGVGTQNKGQATPYLPIRAFSASAGTSYGPSTTAPTNAGSYYITPSALTLAGGITTDYYSATLYQSGELTINKANQVAFTNYSSLSAILGSYFTIYKFGGSGDGQESLTVSNGTASGCTISNTSLTASTSGTCVIAASKAASENYLQADSTFSVNFFYYVPEPVAPVSTVQTEIAIAVKNSWSANATVGPIITSISPSSGPIGTTVTITGTGFDGVDVIKIGRRLLTSITGVSSTSITGVIPVGASSGPIMVSNSFGGDFSATGFTVTP